MNQEQLDVLNIVQELMRALTFAVAAQNPSGKEALFSMLQHAANRPGASPIARTLIQDLTVGHAILHAGSQPLQ